MRIKAALGAGAVIFFISCGWLIVNSALTHKSICKDAVVPLAQVAAQQQGEQNAPAAQAQTPEQPFQQNIEYPQLSAVSEPVQSVTLGNMEANLKRTNDPDKFKYSVKLTSKGAAVEYAILSEFEARHTSNAEMLSGDSSNVRLRSALILLAPLGDETKIYSLANTSLKVAPADADAFGTKSFPLDKLNWKLAETNNKDFAQFQSTLFAEGQETLRITKTYRVVPGSYEMQTEIAAENLSGQPLKVAMQLQGPTGISREDIRQDGRKVMASYKNKEISSRLMLFKDVRSAEVAKIHPSNGFGAMLRGLFGKDETPAEKLQLRPDTKDVSFAWAAITNKYFAAIIRPMTDEPQSSLLQFGSARYYGSLEPQSKKEAVNDVSFVLNTNSTKPLVLAAAGQQGATAQFAFATYLGPKDRDVFESNPNYKTLGYFHTMDFQSCCCPASMIAPLAFGVISLMKMLYMLMGPWGNYGVVIIFLVLLVRLILHPVTKKSQVSMMKMQKLGPRMQEIQKKYANNRAEMNKQVMALYKESGATPVMGMLPMFLQMPIWIALWTAVNSSIDLRGAGFLPFWITDLSVPDQLFAIPFASALQQIPLVGAIVPDYFNLLPILMGVAMYFQQKMMPASTAPSTNPQMAQQQKMMLWMMPLLFPVMLYNGPSGVNLYIMTSMAGGVIEQKVIRKHIQERQELEEQGKVPTTSKFGGKLKKKKPKPFFKG